MGDLTDKEKELRKVEVIIIEENDPEDIINEHEEKAKYDNIHQGEKGKGGLDVVNHGKDDNSIESKVHVEPKADVIAEDYSDEDDENDSFEMLLDGSDNEITSASDNDCEPKSEAPLTDAEIEELIAEFLEVESKAAEAQESLEHEILANVESEVRAELAENLHGDELELAVSKEMKVLVKMWTDTLDNLETRSAILLEQLDGAGIELPSLYKWIESQVPDCCRTEAWRKRAHWVGTQAPAA